MKEIKVVVVYTDWYQQRYTKACLEVIRKREIVKNGNDDYESKLF